MAEGCKGRDAKEFCSIRVQGQNDVLFDAVGRLRYRSRLHWEPLQSPKNASRAKAAAMA